MPSSSASASSSSRLLLWRVLRKGAFVRIGAAGVAISCAVAFGTAVYLLTTETNRTETRLGGDWSVPDNNDNDKRNRIVINDEGRNWDENENQEDGSSPSRSPAGFGACLMIMDDNHLLVEWLAYHYHALPLRHLYVYVDEKSATDPRPVFDRWKGRIRVEYVPKTYPRKRLYVLKEFAPHLMPYPRIRNYLARQHVFYQDCLQHYKFDLNWTSWIIFTDTDEYISINRTTTTTTTTTNTNTRDNRIDTNTNTYRWKNEKGSILRMLQHIRNDPKTRHIDCINTRRTQICQEEDEEEPSINNRTNHKDEDSKRRERERLLRRQLGFASTLALDVRDFATLRDVRSDGLLGWRTPKTVLHVPSIEEEYVRRLDMIRMRGSAHRITPGRMDRCLTRTYFQIYHYHPTPRQRRYKDSLRNDPRGSSSAQRVGGSRVRGVSSCRNLSAGDLAGWLARFVSDTMRNRTDAVQALLSGVGRYDIWPRYVRNGTTTDDDDDDDEADGRQEPDASARDEEENDDGGDDHDNDDDDNDDDNTS